MSSEEIEQIAQTLLGDNGALLARLGETAVGVLLLLLLEQLLYRLINRTIREVDQRQQARIWARTLLFVLAGLLIIALWLPNARVLVQVLAILTAGLALTLSRPISSLMAWAVIVLRTPFRVGDRIEIGGVQGDVIDIGMLRIHILEIGNWVNADQSTGRVVHVPNTLIFDGPVFNYTEGFRLIWNEIVLVVTHDSDWERARTLLLAQATPFFEQIEQEAIVATERMAKRYAFHRGITTPFVYVRLLRDGIELTLRYLCPPQRRRGSAHDITTAFLHQIAEEPTIRIAPPAYRLVMENDASPPAPENHRPNFP